MSVANVSCGLTQKFIKLLPDCEFLQEECRRI